MRPLLTVLLICAVLLSCCKNDDDIVEQPYDKLDCTQVDCPISQEFYGVGMMNDACWKSDFAVLEPVSSFSLAISLNKNEINGIREGLTISINKKTELLDTIWLGWADFANQVPNLAYARYSYSEGNSSAGKFDFAPDVPVTKEDFLVIDFINEDTSIVEGRFQLRFSRRSVSSFVTHAPDSMRFQCGKFRAKEI